jgi:hypothetical protein
MEYIFRCFSLTHHFPFLHKPHSCAESQFINQKLFLQNSRNIFSLTDARARHPRNVGSSFLAAVLILHFFLLNNSSKCKLANKQTTSYGSLHGRSKTFE